jgi:tetratricopeptide (TPR) repeat protein
MRQQLSSYVDHAITFLLLVVAGLTPLLFLNQTTEFYEMPKLVFLVFSTVLLLGLWIFSWILKGKVVITRTPLDIPLLILAGIVILSTYMSATKFPAIYGNFPKVHGSAVSWLTYILLYFVTVSHLKNLNQIKNFLYVLYGSGVVVAFLTLLSFFNIYLPFDFAKAVTFTPTGSSFSTIAFLTLLFPLPLLSILNPNKYLPKNASLILASLFGVTIALIGSLPTYVVMVIAFALCLFASKPQHVKKALPLFIIPVALTLLTLVFAYTPMGDVNKLQKMEANFPKEIQLPLAVSWKISASTFRDAPFVGTGPSTYLFNFTNYKPLEFNQKNYWAFSFDSAYNEFLQVLGTLGLIGFLALLVLCAVVLNISRKNLSLDDSSRQDSTHVLLPALAASALLAVILLAIHATTLVSLVMTFFVLAALMASQKSIREKVTELSLGLKATTSGNQQFDLFPVIVFVVFLIAAVPFAYRAFNAVAADFYHRKALTQVNKSGSLTYEYLQKAEKLNPYIDLYRVDMAQTNFALANAIAAKKGPTKDNPKGSLNDQDKKTIQTLLAQSINEGKAAVALSPRSSRNWEVLASIYRNITGVANNALAFSLDAYGQAIQRDPLNPALRISVGGIYFSVKNYDLSNRFFSDAANLKPDYAIAYYNLSIGLRDKGDFVNAARVAEQTVALLAKDQKSKDYQVAVALLKDLKEKAEDQTATLKEQQQSALANPNLPKVTDLEGDLKEATPEAVKKNPNAKLPVAPTPTKKPAAKAPINP